MRTRKNCYRRLSQTLTLLSLLILLAACSSLNPAGTTSGDPNNPSSKSAMAVTPPSAQLRVGGKQQFSATGLTLAWSVNGVAGGNTTVGKIDATGMYTAPAAVPNPASVQVTAATSDSSMSAGTATVALENPIPVVSSVSPSDISVGAFSVTVSGSGFVNGAKVLFNGTALSTKFLSANQLTATGSATSAQLGNQQITVMNPDPGSASSGTLTVQVTPDGAPVNAVAAARFLEQSTWGPTPALIAHVQQVGFQGFLNEQFSTASSTYPAPGSTDDVSVVQKRFFTNGIQGQDQLRQRMAYALAEIFVISKNKVNDPNAFVLWMNMLQKDALGNYLTLMKDVTLSPAMGNYLDMANNDGCQNCDPNENYAREIMQLFTIGLDELNADGSLKLDGSGNPIPTYTQDTIEGFAHAYTGWTYPAKSGTTAQFYDPQFYSGPMIAFDTHHDKGTKLLLDGTTLAGNGTTSGDLTLAMQNIFNHPNVGPFIAKQLILKLVTSNPSPDYISRISAVFDNNGSGVRGDLKAVVTAILLDPEARRGDDPAQVQAADGHLKEPVLHMMNLMRAVNTTTNGADNFAGFASQMGQEPFNPSSVFNFYPPDNLIPGTQLLGPEFKILNSSTTIARINFVNSLVYSSIGQNTKIDLSSYTSLAADANKLLDSVSAVMVHGQLSTNTRSALVAALNTISDSKRKVQAAFYLIGSSSQFQVEH